MFDAQLKVKVIKFLGDVMVNPQKFKEEVTVLSADLSNEKEATITLKISGSILELARLIHGQRSAQKIKA